MKTFNEIEDQVFKPLIEDKGKIYIPIGGKKNRFLTQLKRLGVVTRVCNYREEKQTSYRLTPTKGSRMLTKEELDSILNLTPFREEDIVNMFFELVERGFNIFIFFTMLGYYNTNKSSRLKEVEILNIDTKLKELMINQINNN